MENRLNDSCRNLERGQQLLAEEFESKLKYDRHKEQIIDNLHKELEQYKNDLHTKILKPMIMDIISVIDHTDKIYQVCCSLEPRKNNYYELLKQLKGISDDLEDVLYRQGVEKFIHQDDVFNPSRQRVLETIDTDCPSLDKIISERIRLGYQLNGKVIRPELVKVYIFKERKIKAGFNGQVSNSKQGGDH